MADNVAVTEGSGKTIASDDVGGIQMQVIKVDGGGNGLSVPIIAGRVADAAALPVALTTEVHTKIDALSTKAKQDTMITSLASLDGKAPALGQALAAASVPVILPSATITTLTPPTNTGYSTAAKQPALGTAGTASADVISVQGIASMTPFAVNPISGQTGIAGGAGVVGATTVRVIVASDQTAIAAKTAGYKSSVAVTRPSDTTAYTALDVLGDTGGSAILTFSTAGPSSSYLRIDSGRFMYNASAVPSGMTGFRLHLYNASPTAIADNAAFDLVSGDRSKYIGYIDVGTPQDFGSTLFTEANQQNKPILLVGGTTVYGILQTITGWTPASADTWTIDLLGEDL